MITDRKTTRIVRSWLEEGADRIPDRVLDAVEARLGAVPQRRPGWLARRFPLSGSRAMHFGVAAVVVIAAVVIGIRFLPANVGGPAPTPIPTPTPVPAVLVTGSFVAHYGTTDIDAVGSGTNVSGSLEVDTDGARFSVDLLCARTTEDGLTAIAGPVTESTHDEAPSGRRIAIVIEPGTPARTTLWLEDPPLASSCPEFLESIPADVAQFLQPIAGGNLELGP